MKKLILLCILPLWIFNGAGLLAEDAFNEIDGRWNNLQGSIDDEWDRFKAEIEQKWQVFVRSTKKDWVEYNKAKDARSKVDFEQGKIVFEAIVPEGDPEALEKAYARIEKQAGDIFTQEDIEGKWILENQVFDNKGESVGPRNLKKYLEKEILPEIKPEPVPFDARDGVKRRKFSVKIDLVPNHIRVRAEKYLPVVKKNAEIFGLKPQLVLAIIHTESYFNPKAISHCNAVGIMQLIPKYAGREAYGFRYGAESAPTREYLFRPENNIELGCAYLHLLRYRHFKDVTGETKNRYVSICGYNWGPTAMRKKIVEKYPINSMRDKAVYDLLRQKTAEETRDYIQKVTARMPIYDAFFDNGWQKGLN